MMESGMAAADNNWPPEVSENREWFWRIVDAHGVADLPSDEEHALYLLLLRASFQSRQPADNSPAPLERVAAWMTARGYATGHGDTIEDMLAELEGHAKARALAQHYGEGDR